MQRKLNLSFWTLLTTSSFLIKTINAEAVIDSKNRSQRAIGISEQLREIDKNIINENLTIEGGEIEIVKNGKTSKGTLINKYGLQSVEYGGQTEDVTVRGGEQIVLGDDSYAYNSEVHGEGETSGQQNVYGDGAAFFTNVMSGGEQNLSKWLGDEGGLAVDTVVYKAGVQNVFAGGRANTVTLEKGALQRVYAGGYVKTLTINSTANALVYAGATLEGEVKVNGSGQLHLYAGDKGQQTKAEEIILEGKESQLHSIATESDGSSSLIGKLSGEGSVIFTSTSVSTGSTKLNPYHSLLDIGELSGNINFNLRVNFAESYGDYLIIEKGAGSHTVSVMDIGTEMTSSSLHSVNLIMDKSGKAHFSLTNHSDKKTDAVDGGTYVYDLKSKNSGKGEGKIWYLAAAEKIYTSSSPSSHTQLPITGSFGKKEDMTVFQDPIVSSYASNFSFYPDDFIMEKEEEILQSSIISEDSVYISDDGDSYTPKWSINNTVEESGTLYVEAGGFSKNTTVMNGGSEIVAEQGISESTIVYEGGRQSVEGGGSVLKAEIYGGEQLIFGDGYVNGGIVGSSAYNTIIYGQGETSGYQSVYDDGMAVGTKIMSGGIQVLSKWFPDKDDFTEKSGGLAFNTEVFANGVQRVLAGGTADLVTLHRHAAQEVHAGGLVKNLTIEGGANSWIFAGATLGGQITVHDSGQLHLYAGDDEDQTAAEDINLEGEKARLYSIASGDDDTSTHIQKLSGVGRVIFKSAGSDLHYSRLYVDELSGSLHFKFHVSLAEGKGDYLFITRGSGFHTVSVVDSGVEIADRSTDLDLIVDQSGEAHFTLKKFSGAKIGNVDGGTYTYGLKEKNSEGGHGKIWYLSAVYIDNLPRRSRSRRNLDQNQPIFIPSTVSSQGNQAVEVSRPVDNHQHSDEKQRTAVSEGNSLPVNQMVLHTSHQDQSSSQSREEMPVPRFLTTPSTDSVLSISVAPALIFHHELQTVRTGRGIVDRSKKHGAFWVHAIKSKDNVAADHR
ncbi:pertactin-like passenger domain-containing protein, partial [Bartonella senegalensis]|uniref:pertactin-like passenger domain-containing protein n=1 Tax=Bartonella senegalensis TaxID=1468418 RepID=UPI000686B096